MAFGRHTVPRADDATFTPLLLANLLPLGGMLLLEWRIGEILVIYWIEVWVMLLTYGGLALFARRPIVLEGRGLYLPGVGKKTELCDERWGDDPVVISIGKRLPPIYPRNIEIVCWSLAWGAGFLSLPALQFGVGAVASTLSPAVAGAALAIVGSHFLEVHRTFFGGRKYEKLSAHMVLEIPCRIIAFAFGFIMLLVVVGSFFLFLIGSIVYGISGFVAPDGTLEALFVAGVTAGKIAVEWSRFRAANDPDPNGFANWFVPEDPREE